MDKATPGEAVTALRKALGLSQQAFAESVGLRSKGHVCDIEAGKGCSPEVAFAIERLSNGSIPAASLSRTLAAVLAAQEQAAA